MYTRTQHSGIYIGFFVKLKFEKSSYLVYYFCSELSVVLATFEIGDWENVKLQLIQSQVAVTRKSFFESRDISSPRIYISYRVLSYLADPCTGYSTECLLILIIALLINTYGRNISVHLTIFKLQLIIQQAKPIAYLIARLNIKELYYFFVIIIQNFKRFNYGYETASKFFLPNFFYEKIQNSLQLTLLNCEICHLKDLKFQLANAAKYSRNSDIYNAKHYEIKQEKLYKLTEANINCIRILIQFF